jgi:hypothetical protein
MAGKLAKLTASIATESAASAAALVALKEALGRTLPPDYAAFLRSSNGGSGTLPESEAEIRLLSAEEIVKSSRDYEFEEGVWHIGGNGAGAAALLDLRGEKPRFAVGSFVSSELSEPIRATFTGFLEALAKAFPIKQAADAGKRGKGAKPGKKDVAPAAQLWRYAFSSANDSLLHLVFHPDNQRLFTSAEGDLSCWDIHSGKPLLELGRRAKVPQPRIFQFAPGGELLVGGGPIEVRSGDNGELLRTLPNPASFDYVNVISADGARGIAGRYSGAPRSCLYDVASADVLCTLPEARNVGLSPHGNFVFRMNRSRLDVHAAPDGRLLFSHDYPDDVGYAVFSQDESLLLVLLTKARQDGPYLAFGEPAIACHELPSGRQRFHLPIPATKEAYQTAAAFVSPERFVLATQAAESTLALHDAGSGARSALIAPLPPSTSVGCWVSPDGRVAATACPDVKHRSRPLLQLWKLA